MNSLRRWTVTLCAVLLFALPMFVAADGSEAAPLPEMHGPSSGGVYEAMLPNGLKVLMKEVHTAPLMCVSIWYRAGSAHEETGQTGLAHLLEHMMFKGTSKYGKGVYDRTLEAKGAQNNASTWYDRTQYYVLIAADRADIAMELEADRMRGALFTQQDLLDEMPVVRNEMEKGEDDPQGELLDRAGSLAFLEHPYHWPTIGWKSDVEAITAEQIHGYYDKYYWPNNAYLVLVGDLPAKTMLEKAVQHFGGLARGGITPKITTVEPPQKGERRFVITEAGQNRILALAYRGAARSDPDGYSLDLLGRILGGGESSRLYRSLVQKGLATDASATNFGIFKDPYLFYVVVTLADGASPDEAEAAVDREIAALQTAPPTSAELERAIKNARVETYFDRDNITNLMFSIGEAEIASSYRFSDTYLDSLAAVSTADCQRVAQKYLVRQARTVGFYLPEGQDGGSWSAPKAAPKRVQEEIGSHMPGGPYWKTGGAAAASTAGQAAPTRHELSNGSVLLVQESHENPTVAVAGKCVGGRLLEAKGKEGVAAMFARTLSRGTEAHDANAMADLLESNGLTLDFAAGPDRITVNGAALAEDVPLLVSTLGEVLSSANFPSEQVEIARHQLESELGESMEDTGTRSLLGALAVAYGADSPYARHSEGTEASLKALGRQDLLDFRREVQQGKRWTFAVVGDVKTADVTALFEKALAKVPAGAPLSVAPPELRSVAGHATVDVKMEDKSQTDIVYLGPGIRPSDPGYFAGLLANIALGGSFASRLNGELRDNQGLTYGAGSAFNEVLGSSYFTASLGVNPENLQKGIDGTRKELQKMLDPGLSDDELARAKEFAAGVFPMRLQSKATVARTLIFAETYGLGLDYIATYSDRIRAIPMSDVRAAIRRFSDPSQMVVAAAGTY